MPQFIGHVGPGLFIFCRSLPPSLRAIRERKLCLDDEAEARVKMSLNLLFGPAAMVLELTTMASFALPNVHHTIMYTLLILHAALLWLQLKPGRHIPRELVVAYEAFMLVLIGITFSSHNMGNAAFVGMHQQMMPLLGASGLLFLYVHTATETGGALRGARGRTAEYMLGLLLQVAGQWFFHIGIAFFLYGGRGTMGSRYHPPAPPPWMASSPGMEGAMMPEAHVKGILNVCLILHFCGAACFIAGAGALLRRWGLTVTDAEMACHERLARESRARVYLSGDAGPNGTARKAGRSGGGAVEDRKEEPEGGDEEDPKQPLLQGG